MARFEESKDGPFFRYIQGCREAEEGVTLSRGLGLNLGPEITKTKGKIG
jgi:hypothetical protein